MCTVTAWRDGERLVLTMNRDERIERAPETAPEGASDPSTRIRWVAPRDGQAGGTWMGVNDGGLAACILNGYGPGETVPRRDAAAPSRGRIVPELMRRPPAEAIEWIRSGLDPSPYPSFTLVASTAREGRIAVWRPGAGFEIERLEPGWTLRTSSSWAPVEVAAIRAAAFDAWRASGEPHDGSMPTYHLLEIEGRPDVSPLMTRSESATRSVTQAVVDLRGRTAGLRWWRRDPARGIVAGRPDADRSLALGAYAEAIA